MSHIIQGRYPSAGYASSSSDDEDQNSHQDVDLEDERDDKQKEQNKSEGKEENEKNRALREKEIMTTILKEDDKRGLIPGNDYYLLVKSWWKQWKNYSGYDVYQLQYDYPRPDAIDNSSLLEEDGETVKRNLTENYEFVILCKEAWDKIYEWYGGGPVVSRKCIVTGAHSKHRFVEIRKINVKVIYSKRPKTHVVVPFSKGTRIGEFVDEMEKRLQFNRENIRVYDFHQGNKLKWLGDMNQFFEDVQIIDQQYMLIEEPRKDGSWPNEKFYQKYGYGRSSMFSNREPTPPGKTGLANLGNTCFMNSALQCLFHSVPLVDFFLSGQYVSDINRKNPLGMKGELADEFAELLKEIWSARTSISEPRPFKKAIEKFAPRFSGYQQHDSQELLAFLLDGLHEDLNRVIEKPYVEKVEGGDGKNDNDVASEAWEAHLKRNKSIIVDLIQGQLKSTLTCPVDSKVSITFDPFMYLTVPVPSETNRKIPVKVYFLEKDKMPVKYGVVVDKEGNIKHLKLALSKLCGVEPERLVLVDMFNSRFHTLLLDHNDVSDIKPQDKIHAHEILLSEPLFKIVRNVQGSAGEKGKSNESVAGHERQNILSAGQEALGAGRESLGAGQEPLGAGQEPLGAGQEKTPENSTEDEEEAHEEIVHLPVLHKKDNNKTSLFGTPFIVSVSKNITYRKLYAHLIDRLHLILKEEVDPNIPIDEEDEEGDNAPSDDESTSKKNQALFYITPVNNWGYAENRRFRNDDTPLRLSERQTIALCWTKETKKELYDSEKSMLYQSHSTMEEDLPDISSKMNLYECLSLYNKEEQLGPNDTWYCSGCKEFRQAFKKFDIWSAPKLLIIHLKRFSYRNKIREKLDYVIDFPLVDLDMSKFIPGVTEHKPIYDLYAVSNHYGTMGGGHYTAYAKHRDGVWYSFDDHHVKQVTENQVISEAAYVLFYKRRDVEWPPFNPAYDVIKDSDDESEEEEETTKVEVPTTTNTETPAVVNTVTIAGAGTEPPPAGEGSEESAQAQAAVETVNLPGQS